LSQEPVKWSRAWGKKFSISFSLQLLISWLAPSQRLDLTNGLPETIQRCGSLLLLGLVEAFGLILVWLTRKLQNKIQENTKKTPITPWF
jgi:NhaP-type Na+/H+ or K+/H+ antiporter